MLIDAISTKEHAPTTIIGVVEFFLTNWLIITLLSRILISVGIWLGDVDGVFVGIRLGAQLGVSD